MINMLRALIEKKTTHKKMRNVNRERETKNQKVMLKTNNSITEMKNTLTGSSVDCILARKE